MTPIFKKLNTKRKCIKLHEKCYLKLHELCLEKTENLKRET